MVFDLFTFFDDRIARQSDTMAFDIPALAFLCRLGMYRDAEKQLKSALRDQDVVDTYLYLCKVYRRLDQPLTATEVYKKVEHGFVYLQRVLEVFA